MVLSTCSGLAAALIAMAGVRGHLQRMAITRFVAATAFYLTYKDGARVQGANLQDPAFSHLFGSLFGGCQSPGRLKSSVGVVSIMSYLLAHVCLLEILRRTFPAQFVIISPKQRCML
ncbi:hypothetical protein QQ045_009136 [Rhodiola kirilowii]